MDRTVGATVLRESTLPLFAQQAGFLQEVSGAVVGAVAGAQLAARMMRQKRHSPGAAGLLKNGTSVAVPADDLRSIDHAA